MWRAFRIDSHYNLISSLYPYNYPQDVHAEGNHCIFHTERHLQLKMATNKTIGELQRSNYNNQHQKEM